jgi:hypothetical protein
VDSSERASSAPSTNSTAVLAVAIASASRTPSGIGVSSGNRAGCDSQTVVFGLI